GFHRVRDSDGRHRQSAEIPQAGQKAGGRRTRRRQPDRPRTLQGGTRDGRQAHEQAASASGRAQDRLGRRLMKSPVVKRSIVITGHKTSVSLEDTFWAGLKDIATSRNMTLSELVGSIDGDRR